MTTAPSKKPSILRGDDLTAVVGGMSDKSMEDVTVGNATDIFNLNGNDILRADSGGQLLAGGAGHDTIHGNVGNDVLYGGSGDDTFVLDPKMLDPTDLQHDRIDGGSGQDTIRITSDYLAPYSTPQFASYLLEMFTVTNGEGTPRFVSEGGKSYFDVSGLEGKLTIGNYTIEFVGVERIEFTPR